MEYQINKAAVIGAGVMGSGIVAVLANAGIPVCMLDIVPPILTEEDKKAGLTETSKSFRNKFAEAGLKRIADPRRGALYAPELAGLITTGNTTDHLDLLQDCDWIIEVVLENLQVKRELFKTIAPYINDQAIVSSNTSGVSITAIAAEMPEHFRRRFLGTHFFNPPQIMRLFELIPGADTDPALFEFMKDFGRKRLGKGVVPAKDTPNFIGNRIGVFAFASVFTAAHEAGYGVEVTDALTGTVLGRPGSATFRTIDMVGLDVLNSVCANLRANLPAEESGLFSFPPSLQSLFDSGYLGDKTGSGSYKTIRGDGAPQRFVWNGSEYIPASPPVIQILKDTEKLPFASRLWAIIESDTPEGCFVWRIVKEIMLYAADKVPEITADYQAIDQAMEWGYNWKQGPFALWDALGFQKLADRLIADGGRLPEWILKRLAAGTGFYPAAEENEFQILHTCADADLLELGDGVLALDMHPKGAAINLVLMDAIEQAVDITTKRTDVKGLVLFSSGKNFLSGADLFSVLTYIRSEDWDQLDSFVNRFHETALRLKYSAKPVVAAVHGMALGGGAEFAMHCSRVVAHSDSRFGLVESGVGVLPSGGGSKEMLYRWCKDLESVRGTDVYPFLAKAWDQIAGAVISKHAYQARNMKYLRENDRIVMDIDSLLAEAKTEVLRMDSDGFQRAFPQTIKVTGKSGYGHLSNIIEARFQGNYISEYDAFILRETARVLIGGDAPQNTQLSEGQLLELEKQGFIRLCRQPKTAERIEYMLQKGKALHN